MSSMRLWAVALAALLFLVGAPASTAGAATRDVTIPAVVDVRLDKALKAMKKADLKVSHDDDVKTNQRGRWKKSSWRVINQDPAPGSVVPAGTAVRLGARHKNDLSWPGQPAVRVPDVVDMRLDKAKTTLGKEYLRAGSFDAVRTERPRKQKNNRNWTVVSQEPQAEAMTAGGTLLRLGVRHKKDPAGKPPPAPSSSTSSTPVASTPPPLLALPAGEDTTVSRVIDGDTIEVAGGTKIRFIGVDAPESSGGQECFGREAAAHTSRLLPSGTQLRVVYDTERNDRYGRTLAYLYRLSDGLFINIAIARDGYAQQLTIPPNVAHTEEIRQAVADARGANRGLWSACSSANTTASTATADPAPPAPTPRPTATNAVAPPGRCHPSYRAACVPIAEDVDCAGGVGNGPAYVTEKDIQVIGPDEYGLDGDNDGIGCETRR